MGAWPVAEINGCIHMVPLPWPSSEWKEAWKVHQRSSVFFEADVECLCI